MDLSNADPCRKAKRTTRNEIAAVLEQLRPENMVGKPVCSRIDLASAPLTVLTLNRPERRNALSGELLTLLLGHLRELDRDESFRMVLVTGTGPIFCSGMDLREASMPGTPGQDPPGLVLVRQVTEVLKLLLTSRHRIDLVGTGSTRGGGAAMTLLASYLYADYTFNIAFPEVKLGFKPALLHPFLVRVLPPELYYRMVRTGRPVKVFSLKKGVFSSSHFVSKTDEVLRNALSVSVAAACNEAESDPTLLPPKKSVRPVPSQAEVEDAIAAHWSSWNSEKAQAGIREFLNGQRR